MAKIKRGMILCAGWGTRLLPITEKLPKPIVPVLNIPNLVYNIQLLKDAGIEEIVVNTHHLAQEMKDFFKEGSKLGVKVTISHEDVLLGTGGGVRNVMDYFQGEPFVLSNCDFVTNIDLNPIIETHFRNKAVATMVLIKDQRLQPFYSKVGVSKDGHLCQLPSFSTVDPTDHGIFTGIHILHPEVLTHLPLEFCGINQILYPKLMEERPSETFATFAEDSYWRDTGDHSAYWTTTFDLLSDLLKQDPRMMNLLSEHGYTSSTPGVWQEKENHPEETNFLPPVVIGKNVTWGENVRIGPFTVIGENATIGDNVSLQETIVFPGSTVEANQSHKNAIVFETTVLPAHRKES